MGIKDFFNIAIPNKQTIKSLGINVSLMELNGMTLAIDGNLIGWQCMTAINASKALTDDDGNVTQHLLIVLNKILAMNKLSINQIWVFDNPAQNPRKEATNVKRRANRKKYSNNRLTLRTEHYNEIKQLLTMLGIVYITAPVGIEGEQYASWLTEGKVIEERMCQYVLTSDPDTLLFKGNMLRQYSEATTKANGTKGPRKTKYAIYEHGQLLTDLDMKHEDLYKMAMVMGHDFGEKIAGTAKGTVYKKVKAGKFDALWETQEKQQEMEQYYMDQFEYFDDAEYVDGNYQPGELIKWLVSRGFNKTRLQKQLSNYINE